MSPHWIKMTLTELITSGLWMLLVSAAEVQHVRLGSAASVGCNLSYLYDTTWLKHHPDQPPTVIFSASLREGRPIQGFQLNGRYTVNLVNRSLVLLISGVEERDLGLYYCISYVNSDLKIGEGTDLQVSDLSQSLFNRLYCAVVGFSLVIMVLAVCVTHWKTRSKKTKKTASRTRY